MIKPIQEFFKSQGIITLLVIVALILGVSIYFKNKTNIQPVSEINNSNTPRSSTEVSPANENLTAEEKILFYNPGEGASEEAFDKFFNQVNESAVEGNKVVIKDCVASPLVLKIKEGSTLTVDNQGTVDINFGFDNERTLVKAGTSEKIVAKYKNGHGIYGYLCDNSSLNRSMGLLLITQ